MKPPLRLLTIAGSDSGGGAGIQADLKTFSALGGYGMSVITALTAQNTRGVHAVEELSEDFVYAQLKAVMEDIGTDAIKIGMVQNASVISAIGKGLADRTGGPVILDPVMVAKSGDKLLEDEAIKELKETLFPLSDLITPNLSEAEVLAGESLSSLNDMKEVARRLSQEVGGGNVLVKGGHSEEETIKDVLYETGKNQCKVFEGKRIETKNDHGTGCTLSSAIARYMAVGEPVEEAVGKGREYLREALEAGKGFSIGGGHGPMDHFYFLR